jgi:predicted GTPase
MEHNRPKTRRTGKYASEHILGKELHVLLLGKSGMGKSTSPLNGILNMPECKHSQVFQSDAESGED